MSNLVSQKAFADLCDVSPPAISKAIKQQRLKKVGTKIDLDCPLSKQYLKLQQQSAPDVQKKKPAKKKTPKKKTVEDGEPGEQMKLPLSLDDMTDEQLMLHDKVDIDQLDKIQAARKKKFEYAVAKNNYIKRELLAQLFARLYTIDKDEFKAFEERLTPAICGIFGFQPDSQEALDLMKLLNEETTRVIVHRQRKIEEFVNATREKKK
jgi:hypothetical protein